MVIRGGVLLRDSLTHLCMSERVKGGRGPGRSVRKNCVFFQKNTQKHGLGLRQKLASLLKLPRASRPNYFGPSAGPSGMFLSLLKLPRASRPNYFGPSAGPSFGCMASPTPWLRLVFLKRLASGSFTPCKPPSP